MQAQMRQKRESMCRKLLTEGFIQEAIVKFILNLDHQQQSQARLFYHIRLAYFYFLNANHLSSLADNQQLKQEEIFFASKINQYLPDQIRVENCMIPYLRLKMEKIPVCGIILKNNKKQIMFVQDRRTDKYGFSKGKIAQDEDLQQCAIRQTKQQTGLAIKNIGKSIVVNVSERVYTFFSAEVAQQEENPEYPCINCQGENYHTEIKKLVWWSKAKIKQIIDPDYRGNKKLNYPSKQAIKKYIKMM